MKNQINDYSDSLYQSIIDKDVAQFEKLLAQGGDLNQTRCTGTLADYENVYPLEVACRESVSMANRLLDEGADPAVVDEYLSSTPLIFCLEGNQTERFLLAKRLIEGGANINQVDQNGRTALNAVVEITDADDETTIAQGIELLQYLLEHCDVENVIDASNNNPLNMAVRYQNYEAVKYIVENNAIDINHSSKGGYTPLMRAVLKQNIEICRLLLEHGADTSLLSDAGENVYDLAEEKGNQEILELLASY